jgi:hypothetical protein
LPNYKDFRYFNQNANPAFDVLHRPAGTVPSSGIYRCEGCGFESSNTRGHVFPPAVRGCQQHAAGWSKVGVVVWRLVAAAIHIAA